MTIAKNAQSSFLNGRSGLFRILSLMGIMLVVGAAASTEAAAQTPGSRFQQIMEDSRFTADLGFEFRGFPSKPLYDGQEDHAASIMADVEWYLDVGRHRILLNPYARLDASDSRRSHVDFREAYWQYAGSTFEVRAGLAKVFWGVTESNHLVDIINQTDAIESPDGEDKLGQPMIQASWIFGQATLDTFVMPFFRERTFPGQEGRLRTPFLTEKGEAFRQDRIDLGARMFVTMGMVDVGVSAFHGTSREPVFGLNPATASFELDYPTITQLGLDLLAIRGEWIFKSETIYRSGYLSRFLATTTGFEYTFSNFRNIGWDLGGLAEYHFDGRDEVDFAGQSFRLSSLEHDVFGGVRLAFNDAQSSEMLAGAVVDVISGEHFVLVEASRRVSQRMKAEAEVRAFRNTTPDGMFHFLRDDSFAQLSLVYYF